MEYQDPERRRVELEEQHRKGELAKSLKEYLKDYRQTKEAECLQQLCNKGEDATRIQHRVIALHELITHIENDIKIGKMALNTLRGGE